MYVPFYSQNLIYLYIQSPLNLFLMKLKEIFKHNEKWIEEQLKSDPDYFKKLAKGQ